MQILTTYYPLGKLLSKAACILGLGLLSMGTSYAQTYQVNGSATSPGNGLVKLTSSSPIPAGSWQTASAWSTTKHNLTQPFDMSFDMFFGCENGPNGGDGITFTFQNAGLNAIGAGGGYLGIGGGPIVSPAISIEFDTYDGTGAGGSNEIPEDHIAIDINGDVNNTGNTFVGPGGPVTVQPIYSNRDLEDCAQNSNNYYTIRVVWNPTARTLQLYEEGVLTMTYTRDLINTVFGGTPDVYWGFTAATGSASNEQWIAPHGSIIPWECSSNSCCLPFTVTNTGSTTVCNNPITLGVNSSYVQYAWSTGATTSTIQTSTPGTYTLNVIQNQGGSMCPGKTTFTIGSNGSTATLSGTATICNDGVSTTPLAVNLTGNAPWTLVYAIDGVAQAPVTGITTSPYNIQARSIHTYSLVSVSDNSVCAGSVSGTAAVNAYTGLPVGHDNTFNSPGTTTLSVDNGGGTYEWYDAPTGGALVGTGTSYTTPTLTADRTYYVRNAAIPTYTTKSVAYVNRNAYGPGGNNTQTANGLPPAVLNMSITANANFTLVSVNADVFLTAAPQAAGSMVTVTIQDLTSVPNTSTSVNVPVSGLAAGTQSVLVNLNYNFVAGRNYNISYGGSGSVQGILYYDFVGPRAGWTGAPANITKDPELSIRLNDQGQYPGIFNWQISIGSIAASCGRTPVTAYANTSQPVTWLYFTAAMQGQKKVLLQWGTAIETSNSSFTIQRSKDGINFYDIETVAAYGNSNSVKNYHTYDLNPLPGLSYYRLKQNDKDGAHSFSKIVSVQSNADNPYAVNVFPNPAAGNSEGIYVQITGTDAGEKISLAIYDVLGRLLFTQQLVNHNGGTLLSELIYFKDAIEPGTYIVSVRPELEEMYNQKLIVY